MDGPAGSGKSSVSFRLAHDLGYLYVDTGAFYRAVTVAVLQQNLISADEAVIAQLAEQSEMTIIAVMPDLSDNGREYTLLLDGQDVTPQLRAEAVEEHVSYISKMPSVRTALRQRQRDLAAAGHIIMVGRDIGTVVLPQAELKFYLDASAEERARRRYVQRVNAGETVDYADVLSAIMERDRLDSRQLAPAADAVHISTDGLDLAEVVERLKDIIQKWEPVQQP